MSETDHLVIDGMKMFSTREAARRVGLSYDYVSRLVREGKVSGVKVGRLWFVDAKSLNQCVTAMELERQARAKILKAERQQELQARRQVTASADNHSPQLSFLVFGQSASVLALALLLGLVLHTGAQNSALSNTVALVAQSVSSLTERVAATTTTDQTFDTESTTVPAHVSDGEQTQTSLLRPEVIDSPVLFGTRVADANSEADMKYLRSLFSDPVTIEFADDGVRGTVVPELADGQSGEPVEILLVPSEPEMPITFE